MTAYKYAFSAASQKVPIGVEEQNERFAIIVPIYLFRTLPLM
jgi:hypothetical protein